MTVHLLKPKNTVFYSISICHDVGGVQSFTVHDVDDTQENKKRVAGALRQIADMLEEDYGECESN